MWTLFSKMYHHHHDDDDDEEEDTVLISPQPCHPSALVLVSQKRMRERFESKHFSSLAFRESFPADFSRFDVFVFLLEMKVSFNDFSGSRWC